MQRRSLRISFLILALVLCAAATAVLAVWMNQNLNEVKVKWLLGLSLICILICTVIYFFMDRLVFRKTDELIRTVREFRARQEKNQIVLSSSGNEIDDLRNEIIAWADDRKNEIERLKQLEVYRKEFLGNVSHELKTPIFNIQGYVLTLLDGGLQDEKINVEYLHRAEKSIDRMITIIDDLEAISQLETGELQLDQERFDIVALARDVIDAQELKATAKGIVLYMKEDKPFFVYADRFRIRQVLVNLIVNSVKYGKEYGETKIRVYDAGENVYVEVADNGIGIARQHLPRVFERFYRVDKSRSREMGGTGLGLAIVKHIIEAHGQSINVMSTEGAGTVFSFSLRKG